MNLHSAKCSWLLIVGFVLASFFAANSCRKKPDDLVVQGTVISTHENLNLAGVNVELYTRKLESGIYTANYELYGSVETDPSGHFVFYLPRETWASLQLLFAKDGYFNWEYEIEGDVLKSDAGFDEMFSMNPKAWLSIHIENKTPVNETDAFEYRILNGTENCEACCSNSRQMFLGTSVNESKLCQIIGQQEIIIQWNLMKGGQTTGGTKSFYIPKGDTTLIEFVY